MLVETKARVGVFAIALGAYLPQFPTLVPEFEGQYAAFKKTLPDTVEVIDGGIVTTKEQSMAAGDKFRTADVDLVILQLLTYATSYNMLPAVRDLDVPVVLVNVQKKKVPDYANTDTPTWLGELYACGAVGEMVADLERAGKRHAVITGVVEGGDPAVQAEINDWCKAAQVRRRFRDTNLAQIGRPYPGMMDLYIDETNLYNRMWLYTKQFDWEKMWAIADNITDEDTIRAKAQDILDTFDIEGGGTVEKVWDMARYVVAFEQWVRDEKIAFVASHYDGFAKGVAGKLDSMLIPAFSMLIKQGTACAVEGDIKVAMAMSILKTIAGCGQLSEMYSIDFNEDICIIGHSGSGDADISTANPILFLNLPIGSTATIVTLQFRQTGIELPDSIARVLLSAILTDTVIMKSPTCTPVDVDQVNFLADKLGIDAVEYGMDIFRTRGGEDKMPIAKLVEADSKEFKVNDDTTVLIAQRETVEALRRAGLFLPERADFNPIREHAKPFRTMTEEEREQAIAKDPRYGRVICRCETITEGEILDALHTEIPATTIDGVKRRCNAGMGRCQGGFCGPRVLELISRTRGIDPLDVLQDKAGSNVLLCETKQEGEHHD